MKPIYAQMVKLVDMPAWGAGARKGVQVRILFWALNKKESSFVNENLQRSFFYALLRISATAAIVILIRSERIQLRKSGNIQKSVEFSCSTLKCFPYVSRLVHCSFTILPLLVHRGSLMVKQGWKESEPWVKEEWTKNRIGVLDFGRSYLLFNWKELFENIHKPYLVSVMLLVIPILLMWQVLPILFILLSNIILK